MNKTFIDYFQVLKIPKEASLQSIKNAYRQTAKSLHPDLNQEDTTKEFQLAQKAYETLTDPNERILYLQEYSYLKSQDSSKKQRDKLKEQSCFYEIFYYQKGHQIQESDFEEYFAEVRSQWFHSDESLPKAKSYFEDVTSDEKINDIVQRLYHLREKRKELIYFEFNGHLVVSKITDLGATLTEVVTKIKVLLHDNPAYGDQSFYGYAIYFIDESLNLWLHDDLEIYYELYLELMELFPGQKYPEIINYGGKFSKLDEIALLVKLKAEDVHPDAVCQLLNNKRPEQIKQFYKLID
ncbi:MAG: J domain-containing protein [Candidatus Cloacimonetes bacterium]|nr:J domain-containing protein [Candidatus Cloacimonadota bacterium]